MTQSNSNEKASSGKGKAFFDRADQVRATGNWDFAIEMYLTGILREPENMDRGHKPLREVALQRKAAGGKAAGMMEQLKNRQGKDPLENLRNAEFLWSRDPGSVASMEQTLAAANKLELKAVVMWIAGIILEAQRLAARKDRRVLENLAKVMEELENFRLAKDALQMVHEIAPKDGRVNDKLRDLDARHTIQLGKYGEEGSFTKGVKDFDKQKELVEKDRIGGQSRSFLEQQIERARKEYEASPTVPGKVNALVDALLKIEEEGYENEAADVLVKAHKDTGAYQFKMRSGDIRIRQMTRRYQQLLSAGDKAAALEHARKQLEFEVEEYTDRAANYPTDLGIKFELGRRLFVAKRYDDAIATLQQAQRDPRHRVRAMILLGQGFSVKQLYREAADTFERAKDAEMSEDRRKEVLYFLGDVREKMGRASQSRDDLAKAMDAFSELAQLDYSFKDVRNRLETLRKELG